MQADFLRESRETTVSVLSPVRVLQDTAFPNPSKLPLGANQVHEIGEVFIRMQIKRVSMKLNVTKNVRKRNSSCENRKFVQFYAKQ